MNKIENVINIYISNNLLYINMDYQKYKNKYKLIVHDYSKNPHTYKDHYIFEVLWAIELNLILWDDIPPGFEDIYNLPHKRDYGIDLISLDYDNTCQVKHYNSKSIITWNDISKYNTYAKEILNINKMILATTQIAKIDSMVIRLFKNDDKTILRNDFDIMMSNIVDNYKHIINESNTICKIEERAYLLECYDLILNITTT